MNESDSTQSAPQALPPSELLQRATALCNELDELMTLHHFFYQAAEHFFEDKTLSFRRGLSLFPAWLRERDVDVLEATHQLQEALRAVQQH
jgi:hypothetical protein